MTRYGGRRLIAGTTAVLASMTVISGAAGGAAGSSVRKELEAIYARYTRAIQRDDHPGLRRWHKEYLTQDFVVRQPSGKTSNRDETIAALDLGTMAAARLVGDKLKITSLTTKGQEAVILYQDRLTFSLDDEEGKPHTIVTITTSRDTWVKTPQGWRVRRNEILTGKRLVDGKPPRH